MILVPAKRRYILASSNPSYADLFGRMANILKVRPPQILLPSALYPVAYAVACCADLVGRYCGGFDYCRPLTMIAFRSRFFTATRAKVELGWTPLQGPDEMLAEAAAFYSKQGLL